MKLQLYTHDNLWFEYCLGKHFLTGFFWEIYRYLGLKILDIFLDIVWKLPLYFSIFCRNFNRRHSNSHMSGTLKFWRVALTFTLFELKDSHETMILPHLEIHSYNIRLWAFRKGFQETLKFEHKDKCFEKKMKKL